MSFGRITKRPPYGGAVEYPGKKEDRFEIRVVLRIDTELIAPEKMDAISEALSVAQKVLEKNMLAALGERYIRDPFTPNILETETQEMGMALAHGINFYRIK